MDPEQFLVLEEPAGFESTIRLGEAVAGMKRGPVGNHP